MIIVVSGDGPVRLADRENFRAFHIESRLARSEANEVAARLASGGMFSDGIHGWVPVDWLVAQGRDLGREWRDGLKGLANFARQKGWVDESGNAIRAHIEWP